MGPGPFGVGRFIARFDAFHHFPHFSGFEAYCSRTAALKSTAAKPPRHFGACRPLFVSSLPRQNTSVAAPPTLPWFWSDPSVVLIRPFRGFDPPTGSVWFFNLIKSLTPRKPPHSRKNHHPKRGLAPLSPDSHSTEKPLMRTIHVWPRYIKDFLLTHFGCKSPSKINGCWIFLHFIFNGQTLISKGLLVRVYARLVIARILAYVCLRHRCDAMLLPLARTQG